MNLAALQVNDVSVEWDEQTKRNATPCSKCTAPTRGRMRVTANSKKTSATVCMKCFPAVMADVAFKPIGDVVRAMRAALAAPGVAPPDNGVRGAAR